MKTKNKNECLLVADVCLSRKINESLKPFYLVHLSATIDQAILMLRTRPMGCTIIQADGNNSFCLRDLKKFKNLFPCIPLVIIMNELDVGMAKTCGELGIGHIVCLENNCRFELNLKSAIENAGYTFSVRDLGINPLNCSGMVKAALNFMEDECLRIAMVQEVGDCLGISAERLAIEFKKHLSINPKKILQFLKLKYVLHLLRNKGLNLKEIAEIAGFRDQRRLNECFHRNLGMSPSECRKRLMNADCDIDFMDFSLTNRPNNVLNGVKKLVKKKVQRNRMNENNIYGFECGFDSCVYWQV